MALVTVTPSSQLPISLAEAKRQVRVVASDTTHNERLEDYIRAATGYVERMTGAMLTQQTVRLELEDFPDNTDPIDLGVYPVTAITSAVYDDADNVTQTLNSGSPIDYYSDLGGMYPKLYPRDKWFTTRSNKPASVRITMTVGYTVDTSPDTHPIPEDFKHAIKVLVSEWFNNSALSVTGPEVFPTVMTLDHLLFRYRRFSL